MAGEDRSLLCDEARKALEKEITELEQKLQLYQLLLAVIEDQCREARKRGRTVVIEYENQQGTTEARILVSEGAVRISLLRPLPRSNPYTKYLLRVVRQLEEESPEVTATEDGGNDVLRGLTVQGVTRDQVEDLLLAADYVFRKMGLRKREPRRA